MRRWLPRLFVALAALPAHSPAPAQAIDVEILWSFDMNTTLGRRRGNGSLGVLRLTTVYDTVSFPTADLQARIRPRNTFLDANASRPESSFEFRGMSFFGLQGGLASALAFSSSQLVLSLVPAAESGDFGPFDAAYGGALFHGFGGKAPVFYTFRILVAACEDGIDNDGDGRFDYPEDPGCLGPVDMHETSRDDVFFDVRPYGRVGVVQPLPSGRPLEVAVLGSESFEPETVDLAWTFLEPEGIAVDAWFEDANRDGFEDLVVSFDPVAAGVEAGDDEVCLRGQTVEHVGFAGCTPVRVVGPPPEP